ncbi:MAG TPA: redoxin domain-containing protein [Verrucomicrobiae bacterium]|nr:redoxin domain-containing protein [Verrucomicrobiae bacterium]
MRRALHLMVSTLAATLVFGRAADVKYPPLTIGSPASDFKLPATDGRTYSLKDFSKAKILALVFTCNHCPTAQAYEERIKRLVDDYGSRGVSVVAINPNSADAVRLDELGYTDLDDTFEAMKVRAAHRKFNFPYLDDGPTEALAKKFGPTATPHVFIFDAERKLRYQGRIDDNEREDLVKSRDTRVALDALLAGKEPLVTTTKVFGCSTKWDDKIESNHRWLEKVRKEPVNVAAADAKALQELRANKTGKVRLINIWATWCGPCVAEFDDLMETNLRFRHRDFELVTIAAQFPDEKEKILKFLEQHHASTRNLYFATSDKYKLIEALDPEWSGALPHTLLIAPGGQVLYRHEGENDFLELRRKIVPALNKITPWPGMSDAR